MAMLVVGIAGDKRLTASERSPREARARTASIAGYTVAFRGRAGPGPNYARGRGLFDIARGGGGHDAVGRRSASTTCQPQPTTRSRHPRGLASASSTSARRRAAGRRLSVRIYYKPLVRFIWLGASSWLRRRAVASATGASGSAAAAARAGCPRRPRRMTRSAPAADWFAALVAARVLCAPLHMPSSPTRCCRMRRWRRARAASRRACAASSARTSRSTTATRRWRATCACSCASGSRPATPTRRSMDYVVDRYGEFVLLRPAFNAHTLLLWLAPLVVLSGRGVGRRARARLPPAAASRAVAHAGGRGEAARAAI